MEKKLDQLVKWMQEIVEKAGCKGVVFGLSGGIDSAVVAGIAKRAFPNDSLGIIMPIHSIEEDEADARLIAETIGLKVEKVDLSGTFDALLKASFESQNKMAKSNIKPRLRMTTLYYFAQDRGYLVAGPSNASEYYVGYLTKHGDTGADFFPLINFVKSEVFELAKALGLPDKIINKKPSAGLFVGQTDEMEMGFGYDELDRTIKDDYQGPNREKIDRMHRNSQHKRQEGPKFK